MVDKVSKLFKFLEDNIDRSYEPPLQEVQANKKFFHRLFSSWGLYKKGELDFLLCDEESEKVSEKELLTPMQNHINLEERVTLFEKRVMKLEKIINSNLSYQVKLLLYGLIRKLFRR